jgi:hypothetical protein
MVFSTKEAAKEYIMENKKCLSFNEIKNNVYLFKSDEEKLRSIVKSKFND